MFIADLSLIFASAFQAVESDPLPSVARIGLAWARAGALQEPVLERLGDPPPGHPLPSLAAAPQFVDRLAVLGPWNDAAREAAAVQGIDVVFVLERARCKSASAVTGEYGDRSGRTARVRFVGAEWDVAVGLRAKALQWKSRAGVTVQGASQPPWSVPKEHLGEKVELEVDPDAALAEAVADATSRALAGVRRGGPARVGAVVLVRAVAVQRAPGAGVAGPARARTSPGGSDAGNRAPIHCGELPSKKVGRRPAWQPLERGGRSRTGTKRKL